jgi:Beta-propeller repeat
MLTKSPLGRIVACVAVASVVAALLIFVMIHHGGHASRIGAAHTAAASAPTAVVSKLDWPNAYGKLPLAFEANQGQTAAQVHFLSHGDGYALYLTGQEAVLTLRQPTVASRTRVTHAKSAERHAGARAAERFSVLRMRLEGSNPNAAIAGVDRLATRVNYFVGNDPASWHTDVPVYSQVKYHDVYPGVDLLFYGNQRRLEYDFVVAPGANAKSIALDVHGASKMSVDRHGNLLMKVADGEVELQKPIVYQVLNGQRREIAGNYALSNDHEVRFAVASYDRTRPLTIDPVLNYVTYLGGSGSLGDGAYGIALDAAGDAYVAGFTSSTDFPTQNPESPTAPGDTTTLGAAFVSELDPTGATLLYSTYLGGSGNGTFGEAANSIAVDTSTPPNIYVTGYTGSADFPVSTNALIGTAPGGTATGGSGFVTKLIPGNSGSAQLGYSSYLGGDTEDEGNGIAVDATGNAYVTGLTLSTDFPHTANALYSSLQNPNGSGFLTVVNTNATTGPLSDVFSTYFGGTNGPGSAFLYGDEAFGVKVDASSNAYIVGTTTSSDFPTKGTAVSSCSTDANGIAFVSVINTATPALTYSTCLGGATTESQGFAIALGPNNVAYVTGTTTSSDFPVTANSIPPAGTVVNGVAFISLLNTTSATPNQYSTFLGGTNGDNGLGIVADATGNAYVTGSTFSGNFPVTSGAILETKTNPEGTGFVAKINAGGHGRADLLYSSYFGGSGNATATPDVGYGIAVSAADNAYIAGQTPSSDLPVTSGSYQATLKSTVSNAFVADLPLLASISYTPTSINYGTQLLGTPTAAQTVTLTNNTSSAITLTPPPTSFTGANPGDFSVDPATTTCTASIAATPATCTYGLIFTPSVNGAESATFNVFDGADTVAHPIQVALTGTGSSTVSAINFSPTSLTFAGQLLTTTSAGQTVTVSNPSPTTALTITAITASTDYTIASNSCGAVPITIAASPGGTPCMLSITFNPSATSAPGADNGTITFTDNANGSPQSFTLNGTAYDFSVTAGSASVAKGAMGTFPVTITGLGGFTGAVSFTCTPGSSLVTACAVPTTSAAAAPGAMVNGTLTAASIIVAPDSMKVPPTATPQQLLLLMLAIALLLLFPSTRKFRTRLGMAGAMLVFIVVVGCTGNRPKTKTTTLTVTPSSNGVTKPAITVNVTIT